MSIAHYDDVLQIIHELMPPDANLSKDFYQSKKLLEGLGMSYVKIDVCKNNCMLYYKDNEHKEKCDICNTSRYEEGSNKVPRKVLRYLPLKDRLQRLYAHRETAESMLQRLRWLCFVIDRTCRGGSRAKQYTLVGSGSPNNDSSQRSQSDGVNSTGPLSQNTDVSTRQPTSRQRGRKRRATTELRVPPHGHRVGLEPEGDRQFKYADPNSKHCKYKMQLGIILKREHPGIIEEKEGDIVIKTRPALQWSDYYDDDTLDDKGQTAADRVKEVFWNLFEVRVKEYEDPYKVEDDADRVLDNYAMKKVRDMMYQLRVDAVKFYFEKQGERLDDTLACSKELEYFKSLRKRGQESRFKSEDVAQNRGGSLPFVEARQILANKYGPEKATTLNTYAAMKCGLKNWDGSRSTSSTLTGKSKKRFDDYSDLARATYPDDWEQRELDGQILYESSGGIPHGRLAIGDGAIKKADVILTAREKKLRPSTSAAHRRTVQENEELNRRNDNLQHKLDMHERLILALFKEMGKELPAELQQGASSQPHGTTNSSHIGPAGEGDLGANGGANNSSGNTSDQAIDATNIRTNNVSAGSGDTSSNNRESET